MKKAYIWTFVALLAIYIALAFALPPDPQILRKYDYTPTSARLLNLTIVIPITLIYLVGLYGFIRIREYANKIHETKEGPAFDLIAKGIMVLVFSLPLRSILSSLASYIKHAYPQYIAEMTIFRQYVSLVLALVGIILVAKGARALYETLSKQIAYKRTYLSLLGPIALSSIYTWLIVAHDTGSFGKGPYYLPLWLVVLTIAIPYVFSWCVGARAALHLYRYQYGVKGLIYKRAIDNFAKGIAVIILISILVQLLTSLSGLLNRLDLSPLLIVVYALIACYVVGYGLIARGAKKLKTIEEV